MRHLLELTGVDRPRVCLLPTASGDPQESISSFYGVMDRFDCHATHVSLFRMEREWVDLRNHLIESGPHVRGRRIDAEPDRDLARSRARRDHARGWESGVLLAGQSAGAMCWFENGITSSAGQPRAAEGLGILPGTLSVHYARDPGRRTAFLREVSAGLPAGYGLDDGAGLLFEGTRPVEAFAGRQGARVVRVEPSEAADTGGIEAREMALRPDPPPPRAGVERRPGAGGDARAPSGARRDGGLPPPVVVVVFHA